MIGTTLNQRFTLEKELGRGGMGAVYRATDQILQRSVAIKILRERTGDEVSRKLRLEAQILARLLHDHIVRLYDFGEADGTYFFVMEEVDGPSFSKRWRQVPLIDRLRIVAQVADALDYAHHQGVIHRDVKPANVLLTSLDAAKLSDFGLSLTAEEEQVSGTIKGTPHYMSPEQAKGKRLDYRTDLYALGVVLYECATGTPPFQGATLAVIASHVNATPDPPRLRNPALPPALDALILRLLEKSPDARPSSGSEVAATLRAMLSDEILFRTPPESAAGFASPTPPTLGRALTGVMPAATERSSITAMSGPVSTEPARAGQGFFSATIDAGNSFASQGSGAVSASSSAPLAKGAAADAPRRLARELLADVVANPVALSPDERYYTGHYLAYLLGGSRRQGFLQRRPLDPLNADRARLMLAMTWLMHAGPGEANLARAAELLDGRFDVRPALSPAVVIKYLASRETPGRRRDFRVARKRLQEASEYARDHMTDSKGVLNPGLMPQVLSDLEKVAPAKVEVDDQLVGRWNRVAEVWRSRPEFRLAVLGYATRNAARDPASIELWPEVVYPLIERARWQRRLRSGTEAIWDAICETLHLPDAGVRLDQAIQRSVPQQVVEKLDLALALFDDDPHLDDDAPAGEAEASVPERHTVRMGGDNFRELAGDVDRERGFVRLTSPDPVRFTMGDLRELWQEAVTALRTPGSKSGHRRVPVGPYRLAVIPSIRGKSAGQIAIQGMPNKQVEMLTPSIRLGTTASRPIAAVWLYQDDSLAIAYVDSRNVERYIFWHAPTNHQNNFDDPAALNSTLFQLGLEAPDQLDRALSKRFRPRNPV